MMSIVVQWATILSPIIAVIIAWWMSKSSAKTTAKQIASIKELARLQIEISTIQLQKELNESRHRWMEYSKKSCDSLDDHYSHFGFTNEVISRMQSQREKQNSLFYEQEFYENQMKNLEGYLKRMETIKQKLEKK